MTASDAQEAVIAVLDVDSDLKAMFDEADRQGLEAILKAAFTN